LLRAALTCPKRRLYCGYHYERHGIFKAINNH
jgi:hypothetical protein